MEAKNSEDRRLHLELLRVVAMLLVDEENDVMLMTNTGKLIRIPIQGISVISRNTQGVKLMGLGPGEKIVGAVRLVEKETGSGDPDEIHIGASGDEGDPEENGLDMEDDFESPEDPDNTDMEEPL